MYAAPISPQNPPSNAQNQPLTLDPPVPRIAAVNQASLLNIPNSRTAGQASLAFQVLYAFSVILSKCALLLLYLRVFTAQMKNFTITLGIVAFIVLTTGVAYAFVAIFQCSPVSFAWNKTIPNGKCIDDVAVARWLSVPNVIDGLVMLIMPIPVVWQLAIEIQQKIALTATFFHGVMYVPETPPLSPFPHPSLTPRRSGFIASCIRLAYLSQRTPLSNTSSIIYTLFTLLEPSNYIIAACLPTLRPILIRILPESIFILSRKRNSSPGPPSPSSPNPNSKANFHEKGKKAWGPSAWKVSWSRGRLTPVISLGSRGASQLTGPWDGSRWDAEKGENPVAPMGKGEGEGVQVREEEIEQAAPVRI